jgi:hypothetical protein
MKSSSKEALNLVDTAVDSAMAEKNKINIDWDLRLTVERLAYCG